MTANRRGARSRSRRSRRLVWLLAAGVAVAAAIAVVASSDDDGQMESSAEKVAHVHGLGVDPADGVLYAATHHGLFRIPADGRAQRVGVVRDLMGFTVAGPNRFLASGHPGTAADPLLEQGGRPLLGLIRSTDAGETWDAVSLLGEADFHALRAEHDRVYGYDSTTGRFMVSDDGERWDVRSEIPMGDFAVSPDDRDHIVAMTQQGLAESGDGGRTWTPVDGPAAAFLSWHPDRGLWAAGLGGEIYVRRESEWDERERLPGAPQALLVTDGVVYAAATAGDAAGIYVSDDGRSWRLRYADET